MDEGSGSGKRINTTGVSRSSRPELRDTAKKEATSLETEWMMRRRKTGKHDVGEGSHKPARLEQDAGSQAPGSPVSLRGRVVRDQRGQERSDSSFVDLFVALGIEPSVPSLSYFTSPQRRWPLR